MPQWLGQSKGSTLTYDVLRQSKSAAKLLVVICHFPNKA